MNREGKSRVDTILVSFIQTHLGLIGLASSERGLVSIHLPSTVKPRYMDWLASRYKKARVVERRSANVEAKRQLKQYLLGARKKFDLSIDLRCSPFQRRVLEEVASVSYGETASYGEIARRTGNPRSARAVGAVMRSNPLPIVIPCHRVIGRDGSLVGFGGGLELKASLLRHEGVEL